MGKLRNCAEELFVADLLSLEMRQIHGHNLAEYEDGGGYFSIQQLEYLV